jgi:hypothetical protein
VTVHRNIFAGSPRSKRQRILKDHALRRHLPAVKGEAGSLRQVSMSTIFAPVGRLFLAPHHRLSSLFVG